MREQFKYFEYISDKSDYYVRPDKIEGTEFVVSGLDSCWRINKEDFFWTMYTTPTEKMLTQGFKIHVSTSYDTADETLTIVSNLMKSKKISFKETLIKSTVQIFAKTQMTKPKGF